MFKSHHLCLETVAMSLMSDFTPYLTPKFYINWSKNFKRNAAILCIFYYFLLLGNVYVIYTYKLHKCVQTTISVSQFILRRHVSFCFSIYNMFYLNKGFQWELTVLEASSQIPQRVARNRSRDVIFARKYRPIRNLGSATSSTGETSTLSGCWVLKNIYYYYYKYTRHYTMCVPKYIFSYIVENNLTAFII